LPPPPCFEASASNTWQSSMSKTQDTAAEVTRKIHTWASSPDFLRGNMEAIPWSWQSLCVPLIGVYTCQRVAHWRSWCFKRLVSNLRDGCTATPIHSRYFCYASDRS
jgi:hypothetical protein